MSRHTGAVWQVCWAHPKFGNIIASCSYDKRVIIWKEEAARQWGVVWDSAQNNVHDSSGMLKKSISVTRRYSYASATVPRMRTDRVV